MRNFKIKICNFLNVKKSVGLESTMLAVYTLSSKKRNVVVNMSTTYNQCQGTNLNHSGTVWRKEFYRMGKLVLGKLLLGKLVTGEVSVGEIIGWGSCCRGNK